MSIPISKTQKHLDELQKTRSLTDLEARLNPKPPEEDSVPPLPMEDMYSKAGQEKRLAYLEAQTGSELRHLGGEYPGGEYAELKGNIENYIGMSQVPTGVLGPLSVNGAAAQGDFFIPLATSEGALVASYNRGAKACYLSGGVTSVCLLEGVQRSPFFKFANVTEIGHFIVWLLEQMETFRAITSQSSRYAKLEDLKTNIEGNQVILTFEFLTGDAAGQNMVTLCTDAICSHIMQNSPVKPKQFFIESNYSGDKKATALSFSNVRGKKVTSEIELPEAVVREVLKTTPDAMADYWKASTLGVIQSGAIGAQGHVANGLAALFLATGQDVACISEASIGITRIEKSDSGGIYASVTLPNLIVGTVGGGTHLPTQKECLQLMGCYGEGQARKFAEICGALALAGEISIAAALSAGHFARAHQTLGRKK